MYQYDKAMTVWMEGYGGLLLIIQELRADKIELSERVVKLESIESISILMKDREELTEKNAELEERVAELSDIIVMLDDDIECLKQDFTEEHVKNERLKSQLRVDVSKGLIDDD